MLQMCRSIKRCPKKERWDKK